MVYANMIEIINFKTLIIKHLSNFIFNLLILVP
jgi:hypothetical protein